MVTEILSILKAIKKPDSIIKRYGKGFMLTFDYANFNTNFSNTISTVIDSSSIVGFITFAYSMRKKLLDEMQFYGLKFLNRSKTDFSGHKFVLRIGNSIYIGSELQKDICFYNLLSSDIMVNILGLNKIFDSKNILIVKDHEESFYLLFEIPLNKKIIFFDKYIVDGIKLLLPDSKVELYDSENYSAEFVLALLNYLGMLRTNGIGFDFICRKDLIFDGKNLCTLNIASINFLMNEKSANHNISYAIGKLLAEKIFDRAQISMFEKSGNLSCNILDEAFVIEKIANQILLVKTSNTFFVN